MKKRLLSFLLCLAILAGQIPAAAFAAEDTPPTEPAAAEAILDEQDATETPAPAAEEEPKAPEAPAAQQPAPTGEAAPEQNPDQQPTQQPEAEGSKGTEAAPTSEEQPVPPENNVEDQGEAQPEQQPAEGAGPADANSEETEEQPGDSVVTYTITFTDELGTASDETGSEITQAAEGTLVTITAKDRAEEGLLFTAWQAPEGLELADDTEEITTFTMPDSNVELAAEYAPLPEDAEALAEEEEIMPADASGATTGSGTKSDPYCVSTYAEMKRLLQTRASYYIKVVGMDNDATNDGVPVRVLVAGKDFVSTEPAIDIPSGANHHLEIATKIWFITKEQVGDKNIFGRLIDVERGSSLEVTGTGALRVEFNTLVATNAIIDNWGGELTIDGSVTLNGIQDFTSNVATRPIYINGGITNIKGGYIYGHNNMKATSDGITSAIHFGDPLGEGTALNISGGTIKQYNNEINQENENSCALYVDNDTVANAIHLTGGTFEGGMKMKTGKPLSNLLVEGYQFNDMSTNTVFDGSVSKTQKALVVTPAGVDTTIINNVSLSVKKSPNERETLSDFDCSYSQNDKMVLDNFGVYPGLNSTSKEIKDHTTPYDSSADYTVMYVFKKKDGFSFSRDVEKHVTVSGGEFLKADQMGGKKGLLRVFVNFPSSSNPNRVKEVSMTMNSKGDFKTIEDLKCQSFVPADKLELVNQMFFAGLKDTANEHTIQDLTTAYQPAADYTGVYVFKLKSGFSFAQDITDLAKKHVTISEGEIYSMDTMTDTDGAMLLRVFVSFEGTDSSIEKVTLNTPTRSKINQAASSVGFMPTSYTPSEKMSYGLKVMVGLNQDETGPSLEDGKFDAKQDYSVLYNLQPKDGFAFAEGFSAKDVTVSNGTVYKVEMSGKDCYVYVNFPAKAAEDPNYVTEAAVQVAAVAGEIPSINGITVTSSNADKIKTAYVLWSNTSTPFVAGQEYSTTVYLEPKEGVTFADDMKLTVNGKVVNLAKKDPNGSVQFLVKITATGSTHTHSYGTDWKYDDTNHWHECECGDKADIAAHSASEWIIDTEATETADGAKHKECTVCKKVLETAKIPALVKIDVAKLTVAKPVKDATAEMATTGDSTYYVANTEWTAADGTILTVGQNFNAGTVYTVKITLEAKGNNVFTADSTYNKIEGKDATLVTTVTGHTDSVILTYTFDATEGVAYHITNGANGVWVKGSTDPLSFTADGEYAKFRSVKIDGTVLAAEKYTAAAGSTVITLKNEYLSTLATGAHTIAIIYTDGDCSTKFTVHQHTYGAWSSDETHHWHECTDASCTSIADKAEHTFEWKIDVPASQASTGTKHEECTVCGKKRNENTVIDKLPGSSSASGSHHSSNNSNNNNNTGTEAAAPEAAAPAPAASAPVTTTTSARTGDSSNLIGWLAVLLISGGAAGAWYTVAKKKKEQ